MRFRWFSVGRAGGGFSAPADGASDRAPVRSGGFRVSTHTLATHSLALALAVFATTASLPGQAIAQFLALPEAFTAPTEDVTSKTRRTGSQKTADAIKTPKTRQPARDLARQAQAPKGVSPEPQANGPYERLNRNTTTIIADDPDGTLMRLAYDMARVLDAGNDLRVLPIVGKGAQQNVSDLLHLKGIDIGLTQSDVLADFKRSGQLGDGLEDRLAYIAKICNLEVHIVSRRDVADIGDLAGKPVNFGPSGSGSQFTARSIFKGLGIEPIEVNDTVEAARLKLERGEIAAYVVVDGKPSKRVGQVAGGVAAKLLALPYPPGLERDYLPAKLSHDDYPDLIAADEAVDTLAVGAVLAVYNWPAEHERHQRVGRLVNLFFSSSAQFQTAPRHSKWRETNFAAPLPGWVRFKPAQDWLDRRVGQNRIGAGGGTARVEPQRARVLAEQVAPDNPAEQQRLFDLFVGKAAVPQ